MGRKNIIIILFALVLILLIPGIENYNNIFSSHNYFPPCKISKICKNSMLIFI